MGRVIKSEPSGRLLRSQAPPPTPTSTPQKLFNIIRQEILNAHEFKDLSFQNISATTGELVTTSLSEDQDVENACPRISYNSYTQTLDIRVMPTFIHDVHQSWLVMEMPRMVLTGFVTQEEFDSVSFLVGTRRYANSVKEPDTCLLPSGQSFPGIVIETGWTESWPKLSRDKDLWLKGGCPEVLLVFLIKWSKITNDRVKCIIEAHQRDGGGTRLLQTEVPRSNAIHTFLFVY
ncbi:hypothetical protein TESG_07187 [Trichophyton tonsurans CBS 112818]|uniref:Uncharacterized protein n=1 Tax=Trichophyton tonsurans (strain CBS 112818) TaxID=647933 RepID=F2S8F0_TRIT1|nr:hypothetical protein TESG_07187 [Trichophyton tonsurans CBS 112818]